MFSVSHSAALVNRVEVGKRLGGDTAGSVDPNWPKQYFVPCNITLSNKTRGEFLQGSHFLETDQTSLCWGQVTVSVLLFFSSFSINLLYFFIFNPPPFFFLLTFNFFPHPTTGRRASDRLGAYLPDRVNPPQKKSVFVVTMQMNETILTFRLFATSL